jgi:SAM-dependent methyltransferase
LTNYDPAEAMLGGFSSLDGTVEFFSRVNALLEPDFTVLDLGAGRGMWHSEDQSPFRRGLRDIRGKVAEYIGADVDPAVLQNPTTTRNVLIQAGRIPLGDGEIDLILCDYVLEHVQDVTAFRDEVSRVLKPGGVFCGRTPHALNYVALAARLVRNAEHARWLKRIQPGRRPEDVFPTAYRCNTLRDLRQAFPEWEHFSYVYTAEPSYYFGNRPAFQVLSLLHKLAPSVLTGNLFVFIRKPDVGLT